MLTDGRKLTGKVLGVDEPTDIAVVKIAARDLPVVPIGDSSALQIGDFTLAIGSPFGLGQSVTFGIVSGIGRSGMGLADYEDFIQTDAAINPGNSGGALLDTSGRLIGINTAILSHGAGGNQGVGFAVPVNLAVSVMRQLIAHGRVVRGFLGVSIQDLTPELDAGLRLERPGGALLGGVEPGTPAAKAGLHRGDVVVALDGAPISDSHSLRVRIAGMAPGASAHLRLLRDGRPLDIPVTLGTLPGQQRTASASEGEGSRGYGLRLTDSTAGVAERGAVIAAVQPNSPADEAGLQPGDVVQENRRPGGGRGQRRGHRAPPRQPGAPRPARPPRAAHLLRPAVTARGLSRATSRKETAMNKTIMTLLVGTILAASPLAAVAAAPSTPSKKPDATQQHKAEDQTKTRPAANEKAKAQKKARAHKARVGSKTQKQSASSQLARDKNLN